MPARFLLQRLYLLSGVIPLGFFLLWHTYTNSKTFLADGGALYNEALFSVKKIPFYVLGEALFIWLPLVFHIIYGSVLLAENRLSLGLPQKRNWRESLFRASALVTFAFIIFHVVKIRFMETWGEGEADFMSVVKIFESPIVTLIYLAAGIAAFFYFAHITWLFLVDWGILIKREVQNVAYRTLLVVFCLFGFVYLLVVTNLFTYYQLTPSGLGFLLEGVKTVLSR